MPGSAPTRETQDRRFMAAALRLSGWNEGRTATNPSVGTLIVRDDGQAYSGASDRRADGDGLRVVVGFHPEPEPHVELARRSDAAHIRDDTCEHQLALAHSM